MAMRERSSEPMAAGSTCRPIMFLYWQVAVSGGEIETVPSITLPKPFLVDVSPDGSTFLVQSLRRHVALATALQRFRFVGGSHRYLADAAVARHLVSGWEARGILHTRTATSISCNSDGTGAHKLASVGGAAYPLSWSPDGSTIRFSRDLNSLWEITSSGSNLHQLLAGWHPSEQKCCGRWSPDGEFFVFLAGPLGPEIPKPKSTLSMSGAGFFGAQPKNRFN